MRTTLLLVLLAASLAQALTWNLDTDAEIQSARNLVAAKVDGGLLRGTTTWDPYVFLTLPPEGIDGKVLTRLTVRLYSSAPADHLAVYYKCDDGRWALGQSLPIAKGLAEYRVELTKLGFGGDVAPLEGAQQWGGVTGKITTFRLDPGNEANRWVALDQVRLEPVDQQPFVPGVTGLTAEAGELVSVETSPVVTAGEAIQVRVRATLPPDLKPAQGRLLVWVVATERAWGDAVLPVQLKPGAPEWTVQLPTRQRAQPTQLSVRAGLLEVGLSKGGYETERATVRLENPLAGTVKPPLTEVKPLGGDPALFVDGKPVAPFFVAILGGHQHEQQAELGRAGVHRFSDWFGSSGASDLGHVTLDHYDYTEFDNYFAEALEADPEAYFLPHLGITPPAWWQQAHPDELCLYADGGHGPQSFASALWRTEIAEDLRRLIDHLQQAPYADRILGYIPFSGYSAEWQSWGLWENHLADYGAPAQRAWRRWLSDRYGADSPLAKVEMPTAEQRHTGGWGALRDPAADRTVIDYYQFLADLTADAIGHFARVVKDATGGRSLCGTYYGYLTQHGPRQQDSSHLALAKVLAYPDIDFLMSPPLYTDRGIGETCGFMSATESVRLHGKLWLSEADYRTHLSAPGSGYGRVDTPADSLAVLWREMANVLTRRTAVSHYNMVGGWLAGPELASALGQMRSVVRESLARRRPFHGDLAVVLDERSFTYVTALHPLTGNLSLYSLINLPRVGVAWDFYLLDDLADERLPAHKLYLFLNAFKLDDSQRAMVRARLQREGATAIWVYAPGLYGENGSGVDLIREVTGLAGERRPWGKPLRVTAADGTVLAGDDTSVDPVFVAQAQDAEVLGVLADTDQPGLVRRRAEGWTTVFSSAPKLTPDMLRRLALDAGCHVYLETGDALFVDNQFVCVHASTAGEKTVTLHQPTKVRDVRGEARMTLAGAAVGLTMKAHETVLLELE